MKILVTGGTGFIGGAFLRLAAQRGHHIAALVRNSEHPALHENIRWISGTLAEPSWPEIEKFAPDVCVHAAWIATPGVYLESPENERYVEWSLSFVRKLAAFGTTRVIALGTCIEYQIRRQPLSEDTTPVAPTFLYSRCKNQLRIALEKERNISLCWGRVFYPYGPGEHPQRLCTSLIEKIRRGEKITLKTPHSTKDYIFIDDLASAILSTIDKNFSGTINFGSGIGVTVREIAQTIADELGKPGLVDESASSTADPLDYVVADARKLRSLGWEPKTTSRQGLRKLIESVPERS